MAVDVEAIPTVAAEADLERRLERLDTCVVSDALDSLGLPGVAAGLRALSTMGRMSGRVRTVSLRPAVAGEGPPFGPHLGARAIDGAGKGEVIVVANAGRVDSAAWGGLLSAAASRKGVAGVVIDGACRDLDEAVALGFAVFAHTATPVSARGRTLEEATDVPVDVMGVRVAPGDLVVADRNGVVFVAAASAAGVLAAAERISERERSMLAELTSGTPVKQVLDHRYETMLQPTEGAAPTGAHEGGGGGARAVD